MRLARVVGLAVLCLSVVYLGLFVWENGLRIRSAGALSISVPWLLAAALLFAGNHVTNSAAWLSLLRALSQDLDRRQVFGISLASQLGKYAPGNIAHQIGRAALAHRRGVPVNVVAWSALFETGVAAVACVLIGALVAALTPVALRTLPILHDAAGDLRVIGIVTIVAIVAAYLLLLRPAARLPARHGAAFSKAPLLVLYYVGAYAFAGGSFYAVAVALGADQLALPAAIGLYAVAWFAGYATPGAPAGLGVREAILVAALSGSVGPTTALVVALVHRLVTAAVDALAFLTGTILLSKRA